MEENIRELYRINEIAFNNFRKSEKIIIICLTRAFVKGNEFILFYCTKAANFRFVPDICNTNYWLA